VSLRGTASAYEGGGVVSWLGKIYGALNEAAMPDLDPFVEQTGWAFCTSCDADREIDVIPPNEQFGIPPFAICMRCGWGVDFEGDAA
jgi:hypothetical protein